MAETANIPIVTITGWNPLACGKDDTYTTGFIAINPQGKADGIRDHSYLMFKHRN